MKITFKHIYSDSHLMNFQVIVDDKVVGEVTYYPAFKELRISIGRSEATVIRGEVKEELSVINDEDRELIEATVKEFFNRFGKEENKVSPR
ncbi:MAG: hypothetical protein ACTSX9_08540 [Candidatus Njordarchaeales archaeon]